MTQTATHKKKRQRGNIGVIVAITVVPLVGVGGGAVDLIRYATISAELQAATDSAILAASKQIGASVEVQRTTAFDYLNANISRRLNSARITAQVYEGTDTCVATNPAFALSPTTCLNVSVELDTYFLKLFNVQTLSVNTAAQASMETRPMEIVFGFDSTGSMNFGSRWEDAKDALENMLDVLKSAAETEGPDSFRAGFVPFSDRVRIPSSMNSIYDPAITLDYSGNSKWRYKGCVEPREQTVVEDGETKNFALTDDTHTSMYFTPSQRAYYGPIYGNDDGDAQPSKPPVCLNAEVVPLTSDVEDVRSELNKLNRNGTGRFDIGAAWVWRVMSPKWRSFFGDATWPKDYVDYQGKENVKVAAFITDGNTTAYEYEVWVDGDNPGEGSVYDGEYRRPWGRNKGTPRGFQGFVDVCDRMSDVGIHVHMIFVAKEGTTDYNPDFLPYARDCASRPEYFHEVDDADDLIAAFQRIGELSSKLRLTK